MYYDESYFVVLMHFIFTLVGKHSSSSSGRKPPGPQTTAGEGSRPKSRSGHATASRPTRESSSESARWQHQGDPRASSGRGMVAEHQTRAREPVPDFAAC